MIYNNQLKEHIFSNSHNEVLNILLPWKKEYWNIVRDKKNNLKNLIESLENKKIKDTRKISELKVKKKKLTDKMIDLIKKDLGHYLFIEQQERCYYCEGEFFLNRRGVGNPTIDHIADKARYPHYLYIPKNLVLSCHSCNGFTKKGSKDVIVAGCIKTVYDDLDSNDFIFVHPYLDEKKDHMTYVEESNIWLVVNNSEKGKQSIKMFGLDEPYFVIDKFKIENSNLSKKDDQEIDKIMNYEE